MGGAGRKKVGGLWHDFMENMQDFIVQKVLKVVCLPGDGLSHNSQMSLWFYFLRNVQACCGNNF